MCPSSRATSWPVARSHSQMARSRPPDASRLPSGWNTAAKTVVGVPGQDGDAFRRGHIPDADRAVSAGRGQQVPIAAERDGVYQARMTRQTGRSSEFVCVSQMSICVPSSPVPARSRPSGL